MSCNYTVQIERFEDCLKELRPLHQAHWEETEGYRHGLELNPDYGRIIDYESRGMYRLFTLRADGELVGNIGIYFNWSTHTQKKIASEDTLFVRKDHRGKVTKWFHDEVENALKAMGVSEIRITVKMTNRVGKLMQRWGYKPVAVEMVKVYEVPHVR